MVVDGRVLLIVTYSGVEGRLDLGVVAVSSLTVTSSPVLLSSACPSSSSGLLVDDLQISA